VKGRKGREEEKGEREEEGEKEEGSEGGREESYSVSE
jgi:hypothetical protein